MCYVCVCVCIHIIFRYTYTLYILLQDSAEGSSAAPAQMEHAQ